MSNGSPSLDQVVAAMLGRLDDYLPMPSASLPAPSVSVASVRERSVGLGNRRGTETRGSFAVVELKGIRLDALVRFQLWAAGPAEAETAMTILNAQLMTARDPLRAAGVLRLALEAAPPGDFVLAVSAWRKQADYRVLYEYPYMDTDGAESLIARIPVGTDSEFSDSTTVTDEMVRWDNQSAAALVMRGRLSIRRLSALVFIPGAAPSGTVTLARTFDGAVGPPPIHPDLPTFLAAITDPDHPAREGRVTFASLSAFLAALSAAGSAVTLGDWNEDGLPDNYQSLALTIEPAIKLPSAVDRLEIAYENSALDQVAVVYLRATRGRTD
jgi:hypothetical protein